MKLLEYGIILFSWLNFLAWGYISYKGFYKSIYNKTTKILLILLLISTLFFALVITLAFIKQKMI